MTRVHLVRHGRTASNRERRTMGWLDGLDTYELTEVKLNTPIDAAKFAQPPSSAPKK